MTSTPSTRRQLDGVALWSIAARSSQHVHPTHCLICAQVRARLLVVGTSHGPQHLRVRREKRRERAGRALLGRGNEERRRAGRRARASLCLVGVACVDTACLWAASGLASPRREATRRAGDTALECKTSRPVAQRASRDFARARGALVDRDGARRPRARGGPPPRPARLRGVPRPPGRPLPMPFPRPPRPRGGGATTRCGRSRTCSRASARPRPPRACRSARRPETRRAPLPRPPLEVSPTLWSALRAGACSPPRDEAKMRR